MALFFTPALTAGLLGLGIDLSAALPPTLTLCVIRHDKYLRAGHLTDESFMGFPCTCEAATKCRSTSARKSTLTVAYSSLSHNEGVLSKKYTTDGQDSALEVGQKGR